jgi:anti-sigma regulatory factor (Ser/Thr protein kinase)
MTETAIEIDPQLIAFVLPGIPESVRIARFHIRAALGFHRLGEYADDAEAITSELVTNAIQHACGDCTETVGVILARIQNPGAVTVIVTDSSPQGPVRRELSDDSDQGRGLLVVDELSVRWGWNLKDGGKAVYAVLAEAGERVTRGRRGVAGKIPAEQCAIVGANVRVLRQRKGWSQAKLGELMGWPNASTVCAAEGHRDNRQRGFKVGEVEKLAAIFGVSPWELTTRCATCDGCPPAGFACLACGAMLGGDRQASSAPTGPVRHGYAAARG